MNSHCHTPGSTFWRQLTDSMPSANDQNICLVVHCHRNRRRCRRRWLRECSTTSLLPICYLRISKNIDAFHSHLFERKACATWGMWNVCERTIENKSTIPFERWQTFRHCFIRQSVKCKWKQPKHCCITHPANELTDTHRVSDGWQLLLSLLNCTTWNWT